MPLLEDDAKPALLDEQLSLRNAQVGWAAVGAVLYPITAFIAHAPSVWAAVMIGVLKRQENAIDRALADPARADYLTRTRPRVRRFNPNALGHDPLAEVTGQAALALLYGASYLDAFVRAEERALGAAEAGAEDVAAERLSEAGALLRRVRVSQGDVAAATDSLATGWQRWAGDFASTLSAAPSLLEDTESGARVFDFVAELDAPRREMLQRTGLVVDDIDRQVVITPDIAAQPWAARTNQVSAAARLLGTSARELSIQMPNEVPHPARVGELAVKEAPRARRELVGQKRPTDREWRRALARIDEFSVRSPLVSLPPASALQAVFEAGILVDRAVAAAEDTGRARDLELVHRYCVEELGPNALHARRVWTEVGGMGRAVTPTTGRLPSMIQERGRPQEWMDADRPLTAWHSELGSLLGPLRDARLEGPDVGERLMAVTGYCAEMAAWIRTSVNVGD